MRDIEVRRQARRLSGEGRTTSAVARALGLPRSTVRRWLTSTLASDAPGRPQCFVCESRKLSAAESATYAYLFGQYLGDGHLVTSARVPVLRIYACTDYPEILAEIDEAIERIRGAVPGHVFSRRSVKLVTAQSYWRHWPCGLPQHGPGPKHRRRLAPAEWQQRLLAHQPWPFIRGLIHSDGCRATNRVTVRGRVYTYPRYLFANESTDILALMGDALDRVGVEWRYNRPNSISIARRVSVALVDRHVGPKS